MQEFEKHRNKTKVKCPKSTFKYSKFNNYSFKKLTITISNTFNGQFFYKSV